MPSDLESQEAVPSVFKTEGPMSPTSGSTCSPLATGPSPAAGRGENGDLEVRGARTGAWGKRLVRRLLMRFSAPGFVESRYGQQARPFPAVTVVNAFPLR